MNNRARVKPINSRTVNTALIRLFKNGFECSCAFPYASAFSQAAITSAYLSAGMVATVEAPTSSKICKSAERSIFATARQASFTSFQ